MRLFDTASMNRECTMVTVLICLFVLLFGKLVNTLDKTSESVLQCF